MQLAIMNKFRAADHYESIQADYCITEGQLNVINQFRSLAIMHQFRAADHHVSIMQLTTCTLCKVGQRTNNASIQASESHASSVMNKFSRLP
jgi:hypothetical protein